MRLYSLFIITLLFQLFIGDKQAELIDLSDQLLDETADEHRVSKEVARLYTWERDVFLQELPDSVFGADDILVVEHRFSWIDPRVSFYEMNSASDDIFAKSFRAVRSSRLKGKYKRRVHESMEEKVIQENDAIVLCHLAEQVFSKTENDFMINSFFEPNQVLDCYPSYYIWHIHRQDGRYETTCYRYAGECLKKSQ